MSKSFFKSFQNTHEQLALKPPFWLISLPLFIVIFRKTATKLQGEDKKDDRDGDLDLEGKIDDSDVDVEDNKVDGNDALEDKIVDGDLGDIEDDDEDKGVDVKGHFFKTNYS